MKLPPLLAKTKVKWVRAAKGVELSETEKKAFERGHYANRTRDLLENGTCSEAAVEKLLVESSWRSCRQKVKHDEHSAALAVRKKPENHYYQCPACGFLHVGHPPVWKYVALEKIQHRRKLSETVVRFIKN